MNEANQKSSPIRDFIESIESQENPLLTVAFDCEAGGQNYRLHRKRLLSALNELKKSNGDERSAKVIANAEAFADKSELWSGDYAGICVFAGESRGELIKLMYPPVDTEKLGQHFSLRPAADAMASWQPMLVLKLSLKEPEIFRFDGRCIKELDTVELPESVFAFSESGALDSNVQAHVRKGGAGIGGAPSLVSQGNQSAESPRGLNLPIFFREIGRAMRSIKEVHEMPLLVVGDVKIVGEFEKVYDHPQGKLYKVTDSQADPSQSDLITICSKLAWESYWQEKQAVLDSLLRGHSASGMTFSNNVKEIYEAAGQARVESCVVACDEDVYFRTGEDGLPKSSKADASEDTFEALDRIYVRTLLNGGRAIVVPKEQLPDGKLVLASLRW